MRVFAITGRAYTLTLLTLLFGLVPVGNNIVSTPVLDRSRRADLTVRVYDLSIHKQR